MIRKISVQDVVSKKNSDSEPTRRERDFLIERLTRKHTSPSIAESPVKATKRQTSRRKGFSYKPTKKLLWLAIPIFVILLLIIVMQFMVSAVVSVKPKQLTVPIDTKLTASLSATTSPTGLIYQIINLSADDSETVVATSTVVSKPQKASGQITIFNNLSSVPQKLVTNTRFESSNGLIYRIQQTISVPGTTVVAGKVVPGSLTVKVIADKTGSNYNIDLTDFTIPGFKTDTTRYTKIFARSKTAMSGGADDNSLGVSNDARQAAQNIIEARLRDALIKQAQAQKTSNSVIFDSASLVSFVHLPDTAGVDNQHVVVHERGTISSVAFDKKVLGKILLGDAISKVGGSAEVRGMDSLHFIAAIASSTSIWQVKPFDFTLSGSIDVIGVVDFDKLMQDILGTPRSGLAKILANYPTIDKATATVKPFWKGSFPSNSSNIKIELAK